MTDAQLALLGRVNEEMTDLISSVRGALVRVRNGAGTGAGTIWHSTDGPGAAALVITSAHVVDSVRSPRWGRRRPASGPHGEVTVDLPDGRSVPGRVVAFDRDLDLAALRVDVGDLPAVPLGDSASLAPGDWVVAVGHPWGVAGAAVAGVIIGTGADLPEMAWSHREWIAAGLRMRPGHSGGPLVDAQGRLVGVNAMMAGPQVGLAVPVHVVKRFLRHALQA